jgi:hypothetical protein
MEGRFLDDDIEAGMVPSLWFLDDDIEAGMVPSLWKNFLQSLLRFVMVRLTTVKGL